MRIVITADPYLPVPPLHYGGIERVVDFLVRGLVSRGHEVTLIAHRESRTEGNLIPYGAPPHFGRKHRAMELWQVGAQLWRLRHEVDLVHSFGRLAALLPILPLCSLRKIQSYQRDELPENGIRRAHFVAGESLSFTACATHMYSGKALPGRWTTVFNGVDFDKYQLVSEVAGDAPLVFLGRLERIKGAHHAIAIAKASGRRLIIAGNVVHSGSGATYFENEIRSAVDEDRIRYLGPVDDSQKNRLLGGALALLMPVEWEEPFGIVMVEAMACGTPVIAFARGSTREVVRDGLNGHLCHTMEDAVAAVGKVDSLRRADVRRDAEARFGAEVIVSQYEKLYGDSHAR